MGEYLCSHMATACEREKLVKCVVHRSLIYLLEHNYYINTLKK